MHSHRAKKPLPPKLKKELDPLSNHFSDPKPIDNPIQGTGK